MIFGALQDLPRYRGIHPNLDLAIDYLAAHDPLCAGGPVEACTLAEDQVYFTPCSYQTQPEEDLSYEAHAYFADLQIILEGTEQIAVAALSDLTEFERRPEADYIGLQGSRHRSLLTMTPGSFAIVFPEDPHKVKIACGEPALIQKLVFKIRVHPPL